MSHGKSITTQYLWESTLEQSHFYGSPCQDVMTGNSENMAIKKKKVLHGNSMTQYGKALEQSGGPLMTSWTIEWLGRLYKCLALDR